ncbi:MAG TPA: hypothetical protein VGF38_08200 [Ktedonobacterales bacterium]
MPDEVDARFRGRYPRWSLLAAIIWMPALVIAYLIQRYDPTLFCRNQYVCAVYQWPGAVHIVLEVLLYLLIWQLAQAYGMRPLETSTRFSALGNWMRDLSEWRSARIPIYILAAIGVLGLIAAFFLGVAIDGVVVVMVGIIVFVAFTMLTYRERRRARLAPEGGAVGVAGGATDADAEEAEARRIRRTDSPVYLFFTAWPWRVLTLIPFIRRWVFGRYALATQAPVGGSDDQTAGPPPVTPPDPGTSGRFTAPV